MQSAGLVLRYLKPYAVACMTGLAACGGGGGGEVTPPPKQPMSLAVGGAPSVAMMPGQSAQFIATLTYSDVTTEDVTAKASWGSTLTRVLTVSPTGVVSAIAPGQAQAIASMQGLSSRGSVRVEPLTPSLALLAGYMGGQGNIDGTGEEARFNSPSGVATDGAGNVYVADTGNRTVRRISPAGVVTTLAGAAGQSGSADGAGADARFLGPWGVAVDSNGNVYAADTWNHTIRKITPAGVVTTLAGKAGQTGSSDGAGAGARFYYPRGVAVDPAGSLYVADAGNHTIRVIDSTGRVTTLTGKAGTLGSTDGNLADALFYEPYGLAIDSVGSVYVADMGNHTIRRISTAGVVTTLAGVAGQSGTADGIGAQARFNLPTGVATDRAGNVFVADSWTGRIRRVGAAGEVTTIAGAGGNSDFYSPYGVATDGGGNVYVADGFYHRISRFSPAGVVETLAGTRALTGSEGGFGSDARFTHPQGIAADSAGTVIVAQQGEVLRVTTHGFVTSQAFFAAQGTSWMVDGVATDGSGNLYVAVTGNHTISKLTPDGAVTTFAGSAGEKGSADGVGANARFNAPQGVTIDRDGHVYVADTGNRTIRKITPAGRVSTIAGSAGQYGATDGIGAAAQFGACVHVGLNTLNCEGPVSIAADGLGNLYVADPGNHRIRKVTTGGAVTTVAGSVPGSADGVGGAAAFDSPQGVTTDSDGNIYVADTNNHTIRKVSPGGIVTTVVGQPGRQGFLVGSLPGVLSKPLGVAISGTSLYIAQPNGVAVVNKVP